MPDLNDYILIITTLAWKVKYEDVIEILTWNSLIFNDNW